MKWLYKIIQERNCLPFGSLVNNIYIVMIKETEYGLNKIHIPFIYNYGERGQYLTSKTGK